MAYSLFGTTELLLSYVQYWLKLLQATVDFKGKLNLHNKIFKGIQDSAECKAEISTCAEPISFDRYHNYITVVVIMDPLQMNILPVTRTMIC